jgi:pyruvate formate lyase activating enzyme
VEAKLYRKLPNNEVECLACKHRCRIVDGRTGICSVRGNEGGKLHLYVYGHPVAVNLDPVEKKPLFHFYPGSWVYSIGTFGCNFRCLFCQNWDISQFPKAETKWLAFPSKQWILRRSLDLSPERAVEEAKRLGADGMAYTYNEPAIWAEYAEDIAELARKEGMFNVFVSSGYETEEALDYLKAIDAYNIDLKGFTDDFYRRMCGTRLDYVLDTIKSVYKRGKWLEITTLVIPGENDSEEQLRGIASFIRNELSPDVPWHITAFHPDYKLLNKEPTPVQTLIRAREIGKEEGLNFVYIGNVWAPDGETTFCPKCGFKLVVREGFRIVEYNIKDGKCPRCGTKIPGYWR